MILNFQKGIYMKIFTYFAFSCLVSSFFVSKNVFANALAVTCTHVSYNDDDYDEDDDDEVKNSSKEELLIVNVTVDDDWKNAVAQAPDGSDRKVMSCIPKSEKKPFRCEGQIYSSAALTLDSVFVLENDGTSHLDLIMKNIYKSHETISTVVYPCKKTAGFRGQVMG